MCSVNGSNGASGVQANSSPVIGTVSNSHSSTAVSTPTPSSQNNALFATAESVGIMGKGRTHNLNRAITSDGTTTTLHRQDTRQLKLIVLSSNDTSRTWQADADIHYQLTESLDAGTTTGWTLTLDDKSIEQYNSAGRLDSVTSRNGFTRTLAYENDLLKTVTGHFGRTLSFEYTDGLMSKVIDPAQEATLYNYDDQQRLETITSPDQRTITYLYEDTNHPDSITGIKENGVRTATYSYYDDGKVQSSELAGGVNKVTMTYNEDGTTTVVDALNAERIYEFETILGVRKVVNVTGDTCASCGANINRREYDSIGNVKLSENANGHITTFLYEDTAVPDLPTTRTEAVGTDQERTIITEWNAELRLPKKVSRTGQTVEFEYNADSQLKTVTVTDTETSKQQITTFDYHASKLLKSIDGSRTDVNDAASFEYDDQGNRTEVRNALGHLTQLQNYDAHGRARKVIDSNELITTIQYDVMGRIEQTTTGTETTVYTYDPIFGLLETVTSPDDSKLTLSYNDAKQLTEVKDQHGNTISFDPDAKGNIKKTDIKDAQGNLVSTATQIFNKLSQLESTLGGEGQVQGFTYDDLGNLKTSQLTADNAQPDNKQNTQYFYDALERQNKIIDAKQGETLFTFDDRDNLKTVQDPNGNITVYDYDGFDNVIKQDSPDTKTTVFTYDDANNVKTQIDNKQQLTQFEYDVLNRVIDITYQDGQTEHYDYDQGAFAKGRISQISSNTLNGNIVHNVTYNNMGRIETSTQTVDSISAGLTYGYNSKGQLESLTYPSGKEITYGYANGEMVSMSIDGTPLINNVQYEAFGSVKAWGWGNGLKYTRAFDLSGRLESHSLNQDTRRVKYNDADNIEKLEDAAGSRDYSYDELHRLIGGTHLGQALLFDYDANSNRLLSSVDGEQTDLVVDSVSNQITQVGDNTIDYDNNGNIILDGVNAYGYDAKNRFINFNNGQVLYTHNAFGLRVKKTFPANAPNATADNSAQSTGNHIEDDFTGSDDTDILTRADNTWASNSKGSALIKGNQANLFGGAALSQTVGTLNEDDSYTLNAKLTQGEITVNSGGSQIVNVRYGFGRSLYITAPGLDAAINVNTSIYKDKLDVNVTWKAGEVVVIVTGTDGTEHTTGTITNSNIQPGQEQSVQLRDYCCFQHSHRINSRITHRII
ncbi:MAG: RHS repeat protein [Methylococcales bacterium]|nr:RHS repeat protein [Methylococcales bacterium]